MRRQFLDYGIGHTANTARLRLADVAYKVCRECSQFDLDDIVRYEGERCPICRSSFDPLTALRPVHSRLILVTASAETRTYALHLVLKCNKRKLHYHHVVGRAAPSNLGEEWDNFIDLPPWPESSEWERWQRIREAKQAGAKARARLERELNWPAGRLANILNGLHCPICKSRASSRPTAVWVRSPAYQESIEELRQREILEAVSDELLEDGNSGKQEDGHDEDD